MKIILAITIAAITMGTNSFATPSLTRNSPTLHELGSAFQTQRSMKPDQNDITIVYGGEDVSAQHPTLQSVDKTLALA